MSPRHTPPPSTETIMQTGDDARGGEGRALRRIVADAADKATLRYAAGQTEWWRGHRDGLNVVLSAIDKRLREIATPPADPPAPSPPCSVMAEAPAQISGLLPSITRLQQDQLVRMLTTDTEASRHDGFFLALASFGFVRYYIDSEYGTFWTLTEKGRARASTETAFRQPALFRLAPRDTDGPATIAVTKPDAGAAPVTVSGAAEGRSTDADGLREAARAYRDAHLAWTAFEMTDESPASLAHADRLIAEIKRSGKALDAALAGTPAGDGLAWRNSVRDLCNLTLGAEPASMAAQRDEIARTLHDRIGRDYELPAPPRPGQEG